MGLYLYLERELPPPDEPPLRLLPPPEYEPPLLLLPPEYVLPEEVLLEVPVEVLLLYVGDDDVLLELLDLLLLLPVNVPLLEELVDDPDEVDVPYEDDVLLDVPYEELLPVLDVPEVDVAGLYVEVLELPAVALPLDALLPEPAIPLLGM